MQPDAIVDLHYLPCIHFFAHLTHVSNVWVEVQNTYEKQTCCNRCYVLGANQVQRLSIPVVKPTAGQPYATVRIDYRERWQNNHWRTIASAYGKAPYFEHYADALRQIIYAGEEYLATFNLRLLTTCLGFLNLPVNISTTSVYSACYNSHVTDLRGQISCTPVLQTDKPAYVQLFGQDFVYNLSILDLLFAEGPQSILYLQKVMAISHKQISSDLGFSL